MTNEFYFELKEKRDVVRDRYEGADALKNPNAAFRYLPPKQREADEERLFASDPKRRTRYRTRLDYAVYENFFRTTIDDAVGAMRANAPFVRFGEKDDAESPPEVVELAQYETRKTTDLKG